MENELSKGTHAGFAWRVLHNGIGYRCGYVLIPEGHLWHGKDYGEIDADVHGGLTYSEDEQGEYWIGFDCAHSGDARDPALTPESLNRSLGRFSRMSDDHGSVKTTEFVETECRSLCEQAAAAASQGPQPSQRSDEASNSPSVPTDRIESDGAVK